jgi:hypothetical protein
MLGKTPVTLLSMSGMTTFTAARSLAALAATLLVATGAALALATPAADAAKPCWERVLDDWVDNGRIDGVYSAGCLEAARKHVPEDIRAYSDFEDRIDEAMQDRAIQSANQGNTHPPDQTSTTGSKSSKSEPDPQPKADPSKPRDEGPISAVLSTGTNDANSIPLPLIILAGLALLLMAAGATGLVARKVQARRSRSS